MSAKYVLTSRLSLTIEILLLAFLLIGCQMLESVMPATKVGLVRTLRGHTEAISVVAFSSDGATLASGSVDTTVRLWDVATGEEQAVLKGHPTAVYSVAFSPDGKDLASINGWYWAPSSPLQFGEDRPLQTLTPSKERPAPLPNNMILWELASATEQRRWVFDTPLYAVAFSPDGRTLAVGGGDPMGSSSAENAVRLWDLSADKWEATLREHSEWGPVFDVAFSPDGTILASGNGGGVTLWEVATGRSKVSLDKGLIRSVAFSPDSRLLASGSVYGLVRLWDMTAYQEQATLGQHDGIAYALAFSPDGKILVSAGQDGKVRLWNVATENVIATIRIPQTQIWSVAFSPDGTLLASGSSDGLIRLWDVAQVLGGPKTVTEILK
jgi:WD40 repeat protein